MKWLHTVRVTSTDLVTTTVIPARSPALIRRLSHADWEALGIWGLAHVTLFLLAWASAWALRSTQARGPLAPFQRWDADWQQSIAAHGYFSAASKPHAVAFFPGYPLVLAAAHLVLRNWVISELVVSAAAGCVVMIALTRLAGTSRAAVALVTMPAAVFLLVGYQEILFLAFAVPAWLAGRRESWWVAGLLAAAAGVVRPDGVWLTIALIVMALTGSRLPAGRRISAALRAATGLLGPAAYEVYLWANTGTPWAWPRAQQAGWDIHLVSPWTALHTTWWAAAEHPFAASYSFEFQIEIAALFVMLAATVWFAAVRRWPEATLCVLATVAVGTQTWYMGVPRTLLVLFPIAVAIARWPERGQWGQWAWRLWLAVSGALAVVLGLVYLVGQYAG